MHVETTIMKYAYALPICHVETISIPDNYDVSKDTLSYIAVINYINKYTYRLNNSAH